MPVNLNVKGNVSLNTRLYFSKSGSQPAKAGSDQAGVITLRRPTTSETFFRRLRNAVTFGAWTRHVSNPQDWRAFKAAVVTQWAAKSGPEGLSPQAKLDLETAFAAYDHGTRLTRSKASAVLADIDRALAPGGAGSLKPLPEGGLTRLGQGVLSRAANTVHQQRSGRNDNSNIAAVDGKLNGLAARLESTKPARAPSVAESVGSQPEIGRNSQAGDEWGDAVVSYDDVGPIDPREEVARDIAAAQRVLQLGQPGPTRAIEMGLQALAEQYKAVEGKSLLHPDAVGLSIMDGRIQTVSQHIEDMGTALLANPSFQRELQSPSATSVVAIPLGLLGGRSAFHENHSVLLAVDVKQRQVLFLDPKGESPRAAERNYSNTEGLQQGLENFGKQIFGNDWQPTTGVVMLANAKQQGANDCFAFTHDFSRRLIEGQSVGDIDRNMDVRQRDGVSPAAGQPHDPGTGAADGMRARMARDIHDWLEPQIAKFEAPLAQGQDA